MTTIKLIAQRNKEKIERWYRATEKAGEFTGKAATFFGAAYSILAIVDSVHNLYRPIVYFGLNPLGRLKVYGI